MNIAAKIAPVVIALPFLSAQQAPTESVRPPASHKLALAVAGLLGWQVGPPSTAFKGDTFLDATVRTDAAGMGAIEAISAQQVSSEIAKPLDEKLTASEREAIRSKLNALKMRAAYRAERLGPHDGATLDFARSIGAEL